MHGDFLSLPHFPSTAIGRTIVSMAGGKESPMESQVASDRILVIEPGSYFLRIGRATDVNPAVLPHVIARRRRDGGQQYQDPVLPPDVKLPRQQMTEIEETRLAVSHTLQSCLKSDGTARFAAPPQMVASFNKHSQPVKTTDRVPEWTPGGADCIVGDQVLTLDPSCPYNVHFPMRRGRLNLHSGPGGSRSSVMADLEVIWLHCIERLLGITRAELEDCRVVLVLPCVYDRATVKALAELLVNGLGFASFFLIQDHVAAAFGSGSPAACIVDIGDQKTSISCVEDGMSIRETRIHLEYGGSDVTQTFYWLLKKSAFPYKQCMSTSRLDALLLHKLKETYCHVDLDTCGPQEHTFRVSKPHHASLQYTLQLGDECIIAPLSYFHPALFHLTGPKQVRLHEPYRGDPDDPLDAAYLRETGRKRETQDAASEPVDQSQLDDDVDVMEPSQSLDANGQIKIDRLLSLDQAILQSVDQCGSDELKRKFYSCVVVVGGGAKFAGFANWLRNRLSLQVPYQFRPEHMEIVTEPREQDPQVVTWKGACIMACMESASELWIRPSEWRSLGVRILREKAAFFW
ncbi:actin-related protein 8-like [Pollicipes pollicipes]|uniref:actin-related protein 8-like n=1 Tax=Pollicipes pollicipes TaxID=41117 RepID=UPI0018852176|nr:actin-related protein 8-like [Pollicipes pollicipes]